ncbi:MAG: leucine-rich repeat protein [Bacteroidales bacterium]|nr:leucine-rich repeat protein [Bacteroidales bacterium]
MSIATAIQNAQQKVANAYTAAAAKGAIMPATQNLSNLATTISSVSGGGQGVAKTTNPDGVLVNICANIIDLNGATDVGERVLSYAYYGASFPANTSANLSSLTKLSGFHACENMCNSCTGLTSVNLSSLTTISGTYACSGMFANCTGITSINMSALKTITINYACQGMFSGCTGLTSANLSVLTTISGSYACNNMFSGCAGLTSVNLSALTTIESNYTCQNMFANCIGLTSISFPALQEILPATFQNQFSNMFNGCTKLKEIHFPANMQSRVEQMIGYATQFGATNATIYFDL